nr:MAG TPA: hypothetical protein [Caudoviricetes sp.]
MNKDILINFRQFFRLFRRKLQQCYNCTKSCTLL